MHRRSLVADLENLRTRELVARYERVFGRLHPKIRQRILRTARSHGWDREDEVWLTT